MSLYDVAVFYTVEAESNEEALETVVERLNLAVDDAVIMRVYVDILNVYPVE